ncbi:SMI1/KNR4 family protein [Nannocystis pusilla]|uniref:SMI1/KNR4 family protein n=1 Tax=Nannocystis pusilla TaxID=889268 RepID=UPI003BF2AEDB
MKIHWSDLDLINEGLELDDTCRLDPATGRFTMEEVGYPFLAGVWPRRDERHLWGASMDRPERGTVVRARYLMRRLRARRACASGLADPAQRDHMLRVLDGEGSPEQRAALANYIEALPPGPRRRTSAELVERVEQERDDRNDAILWRDAYGLDDDALTHLRIVAFDRELRRVDREAREVLMESQYLSYLDAIWRWAERLPEPPDEPPPWLPEVLAWREREAAAQRARVDGLLARLERWLATQAPAIHAKLRPGADPARLDACERELGRPLPPALRQLWAWHDGGGEFMPIAFVYSLYSVDEALARRAQVREWFADEPQWWSPAWLPVLYDPSGNNICLDPSGEFGGEPDELVGFWHDDNDREIVAYDFESLLDTLVALYESGEITADGDDLDGVSQWDWTVWSRRRVGSRPPTFEVASPG